MYSPREAFCLGLLRTSLLLSSCLGVVTLSASASVITFTGEDLNVGPGGAHPNSSAAAASFFAAASALGTVSTITFESAPVGAVNSLTVAPGVTISGTDYQGDSQQLLQAPSFAANPSLGGFNTTSGGAKYVNVLGGSLVFNFATPTQFFGAYLTGVQTAFYQDTFTFSDGTTQIINVPGSGTSSSIGATDFVGFTDAGKSISSVSIYAGSAQAGADEIGVDDVQYQTTPVAATPEPGSLLLVGSGLLAIVGVARKRFV